MKFEKLTENKLNIILDLNDLKEKNIDLNSIMSNSSESQNLFIEILRKAEKEIGFNTSNYTLHIDTYATTSGKFIFTITRTNLLDKPKTKKLFYKRKIFKLNQQLTIYSFNCFEDYCNFCSILNIFPDCNFGNSSLIQYNSKYYLMLNNINMTLNNSKYFFACISEFANLCSNSNFFSNILLEHGKILIPQKAIEIGIKYFG